MNWTNIPAGTFNAATQRMWNAFGDQADTVANRLVNNPTFMEGVANLIITGGIQPSVAVEKARKIMGSNFSGIEEAVKNWGIIPTKRQLALLSVIPWGEETLQKVRDTHILVAVFPISILDIRKTVDRKLFYSHEDAWYNDQPFAQLKGETGWYLISKEPVQNSTSKNWTEQQALLSKDEETPTAQVVTFTAMSHFLNTGEKILESVYVRCSDLDSGGGRVCVGDFGAKGWLVSWWIDGDRRGSLGLAACRI